MSQHLVDGCAILIGTSTTDWVFAELLVLVCLFAFWFLSRETPILVRKRTSPDPRQRRE